MADHGARRRFGQALADSRKKRGLSQTELGQRVGGVVQSTVSAWETGVTEPTPKQVFAMETMLGLKSGDLSKALGYLPALEKSHPSAEEYVDADPHLEPWAKQVLLGIYRVCQDARWERQQGGDL